MRSPHSSFRSHHYSWLVSRQPVCTPVAATAVHSAVAFTRSTSPRHQSSSVSRCHPAVFVCSCLRICVKYCTFTLHSTLSSFSIASDTHTLDPLDDFSPLCLVNTFCIWCCYWSTRCSVFAIHSECICYSYPKHYVSLCKHKYSIVFNIFNTRLTSFSGDAQEQEWLIQVFLFLVTLICTCNLAQAHWNFCHTKYCSHTL